MFYNNNYISLCTKSAEAADKCAKSGYHYHENYLSMDDPGVGAACAMMFCMGIVYWLVIAIIESGKINMEWFRRRGEVQRKL